MLHVERLLVLRELRAIMNVRSVCMSLYVVSTDAGVRGARDLRSSLRSVVE